MKTQHIAKQQKKKITFHGKKKEHIIHYTLYLYSLLLIMRQNSMVSNKNKCSTTYWALSLALAPDSRERADSVLDPLRAVLKLSQAWFCWAMSWTRCSREKWVPWARFLYSAALRRSSMTSANQFDKAGAESSTGPLCATKENGVY